MQTCRYLYRKYYNFLQSSVSLFFISLFFLVETEGAVVDASVTSYFPGQTIEITGSGYDFGEPVTLSFSSLFDIPQPVDNYLTVIVMSDQAGNFIYSLNSADFDASDKMGITAVGENSGNMGELQLQLNNTILSLEISSLLTTCIDTFTTGSITTICARLEQICADGNPAPLPGREVSFWFANGSCGIGAGQTFLGVATTDIDGHACLSTTDIGGRLLVGENSIRATFDGEQKPGDEEAANSACVVDGRSTLSSSNDCQKFSVAQDCEVGNDGYDIIPSIDSADIFFVETVDIDRDNYTDIIYTGETALGLFVAFGTPNGDLETPINVLSISAAAIETDYLDSDTLLDIVAVTSTTVYLLFNNGDRTFTIDSLNPSSALSGATFTGTSDGDLQAGGSIPSVATEYFDEDDFLDIILAPNFVLLGTSSGNVFMIRNLPFTFDVVDACNFDNDGTPDIVVTRADSTFIYLNDGAANFTNSFASASGQASAILPPVFAVADINRDANCDYALVLPLENEPGVSKISIVYGDGNGGILRSDSIRLAGLAYNLVVADVNHDNLLDLVVANGTTNQLFIYVGNGLGFDEPIIVDLGAGETFSFALSTLDLDRDGNFDFVSGGFGGGSLIIALDQQGGDSILIDEMTVTGFSNLDIFVQNPDSLVISQLFSTVAGSDYQQLDVNGDGNIDDRTLDYNLQIGEYCVTAVLEPDATDSGFTFSIGIDGSQQLMIANDYHPNDGPALRSQRPASDTVVFCFDIQEINAVSPANGSSINISRPVFDWSGLVDLGAISSPNGANNTLTYQLQVDAFLDFPNPILDTTDLASTSFQMPIPLGNDTIFYWRIRSFDGSQWSEYSHTFAVFVTDLCCIVSTGNIDQDVEGRVDIADVTKLIAHLFVTFDELPDCAGVGDVNADGNVDISDLTEVIAHAFGIGPPVQFCP